MKKIFSFVFMTLFAAVLSISLGNLICDTFNGVVSVSLFGGILFALVFGIFTEKETK